MGEEIVAWCDDKGRVCVAEAYCPHLGSYLGSDAGGCVRGGRLVCPFHGFEFDAAGQCVATPFAEPPRTARLRVFETREIAGLILGWWGIGGRGPQWESSYKRNLTRQAGPEPRSRQSGFPAIRRIRRKTPWTWRTSAIYMDTAM